MLLVSLCATTLALNSSACLYDPAQSQPDSPQNVAAVDSSVLSSKTASSPSISPASNYLVGVGKADITGAAAETGMFGYAVNQVVEGLNDRLYARAFIIAQKDQPEKSRIVYVSADMGAMFVSVKLEVIKRLQAEFGPLYNDDNVMLTATHTHVGNSGFSHQRLYQIASQDDTGAGYSLSLIHI